jgi:hypothetical protein
LKQKQRNAEKNESVNEEKGRDQKSSEIDELAWQSMTLFFFFVLILTPLMIKNQILEICVIWIRGVSKMLHEIWTPPCHFWVKVLSRFGHSLVSLTQLSSTNEGKKMKKERGKNMNWLMKKKVGTFFEKDRQIS